MIVRNCAAELDRCLRSFAAYPDELVIVNTGISPDEEGFADTNMVAERYGAKVFHFPWIEDFAAARNFSFAQCSNDYVMWLDTDDTVENPKGFAIATRNTLATGTLESIHVEYLYDFDESGRCTTRLQRERVVDRRFYEWVEPIHEILHEKHAVRRGLMPPEVGRVIHHRVRDDAGQRKSLERNIRVFEENFVKRGRYCGERMLFYWGNTLMGLHRHEEAIEKYKQYVPLSGNPAEIQMALCSASECCRAMKRFKEAKAYAYQAIEINPETPSAYLILAQAQFEAGNKKLARHFAKMCVQCSDNFDREMVSNPKAIHGTAAIMVAQCAYEEKDLDECVLYMDHGAKVYGESEPSIVEMRGLIAKEKDRQAKLQAFFTTRQALREEGRDADIQKLAEAAPEAIREHAEVIRHVAKKRPAGKPTLVIAAPGGMPGGWGPENLKTGIGGSEEAICYLGEAMARRGWNVEVYASCKRQSWNGVEWYPYSAYVGEGDSPEALIVWRFPGVLTDAGTGAKTKWYWAHDMPNPGAWFLGSWNAFDGMFFVSKYHADQYDFIPAEKKIVSANGMHHQSLAPLDDLANENHRLVYASCPMRGLVILLQWWEYIKQQAPEAELDIYYGFHPTLMSMLQPGTDGAAARRQVVTVVNQLKNQPGINWKGFVGQEELHKGFAKAGIWAYPCIFPEVSCITAMKMQAHGVVPVTTSNFALAETVHRGVKIDGNMGEIEVEKLWADAVIAQIKNPWTKEQRLEMARDARASFNWEAVADQWDSLIRARLSVGSELKPVRRGDLSAMKALV